jgi:hypothetical protein
MSLPPTLMRLPVGLAPSLPPEHGSHVLYRSGAKPNPNLAKLSQIQQSPAKENQRNFLGFPSPNRALSRGYADPPRRFFFLPPLPALEADGGRRCLFAPDGLPSFCLRFRVLRSDEASEGLAPFL